MIRFAEFPEGDSSEGVTLGTRRSPVTTTREGQTQSRLRSSPCCSPSRPRLCTTADGRSSRHKGAWPNKLSQESTLAVTAKGLAKSRRADQ